MQMRQWLYEGEIMDEDLVWILCHESITDEDLEEACDNLGYSRADLVYLLETEHRHLFERFMNEAADIRMRKYAIPVDEQNNA